MSSRRLQPDLDIYDRTGNKREDHRDRKLRGVGVRVVDGVMENTDS